MEITRLGGKILRKIYTSPTDKKMPLSYYDNVPFWLMEKNEFDTKYLYFNMIIIYVYGFFP